MSWLETQEERDGVAPFRAQAEAVEATTRAEGASRRLDGNDGGGELLTTSGYGRVYGTAMTASSCGTTATHATHTHPLGWGLTAGTRHGRHTAL